MARFDVCFSFAVILILANICEVLGEDAKHGDRKDILGTEGSHDSQQNHKQTEDGENKTLQPLEICILHHCSPAAHA